MKFIIEGPSKLEASKVEVKDDQLVVSPTTIKGQHVVRTAYVTAKGDGGTESKAVVLFNANTGQFTLQMLDGDPVKFDFDKPKAEFKKKRDASKAAGKKGHDAKVANENGDSSEKTD